MTITPKVTQAYRTERVLAHVLYAVASGADPNLILAKVHDDYPRLWNRIVNHWDVQFMQWEDQNISARIAATARKKAPWKEGTESFTRSCRIEDRERQEEDGDLRSNVIEV